MQTSLVVQASLSSQDAVLGVYTQALPTQSSSVQTLSSLQTIGVPAEQTPLWHVSAPLQASASAQLVPSDLGVAARQPSVASHTSAFMQFVSAAQVNGVPFEQTPLWHVSRPLQTVLSSQAVLSALIGSLHAPAVQVPASWH